MTRFFETLGAVPGNPFRLYILGCFWFGVICLIACVVLAQLPLNPAWSITAGAFAGAVVVALLVTAYYSRQIVEHIKQIRSGDYYAHWRYEQGEWARFEEAEWGATKRESKLAPFFGFALAVIVGGIVAVTTRDLIFTGAMFGILFAIGLVISITTWVSGRLRYANRDDSNGDVYIGVLGVLQPRGYLPLAALNQHLTKVEVVPGERAGDVTTLRFTTESWTEDLTTRASSFRIPVPQGRDDEAVKLAERLLREVGVRR